ncbi:MAG: hypothetical protein AAF934_02770 [Bacteroidota bacterium]
MKKQKPQSITYQYFAVLFNIHLRILGAIGMRSTSGNACLARQTRKNSLSERKWSYKGTLTVFAMVKVL